MNTSARGSRLSSHRYLAEAMLAATLLVVLACSSAQSGDDRVAGSTGPQATHTTTGASAPASRTPPPTTSTQVTDPGVTTSTQVTDPGVTTSLPPSYGNTAAQTSQTMPPPASAAQIATKPQSLKAVNPATPISVEVTDGTLISVNLVHPADGVNCGSMAAFLFRLTHPGEPSPTCTSKPFPDVSTSNVFCGYIHWAVDKHIT